MDRIEQTYSVLTVSAADKFSASLHTLLPEGQYDPVRAVRDATSARRLVQEQHVDNVVVNAPLPDAAGAGAERDERRGRAPAREGGAVSRAVRPADAERHPHAAKADNAAAADADLTSALRHARTAAPHGAKNGHL